MLSPALKDLLNTLQFREESERRYSDALGTLYWDKEMLSPSDPL
jgi:hypothetical protein